LSAVSPFFKTILRGAESPEMDFRDFPSKIIEQLVQFIYTGEIIISKADVAVLHSVATNLDIHSLIDMMQHLMDLQHEDAVIEVDADSETAFVPSHPKTAVEPKSSSAAESNSPKQDSTQGIISSVVNAEEIINSEENSSQLILSDIKHEKLKEGDLNQDDESGELDLSKFQMKKVCMDLFILFYFIAEEKHTVHILIQHIQICKIDVDIKLVISQSTVQKYILLYPLCKCTQIL
jgi:hypothetical protein